METIAAERPCDIVVIRHAPTAAAGRCYGRLNVPVTQPAPQAASVVRDRVPLPIRTIWSSPSARCLTLAQCLGAFLAVPLRVDARLLELSYRAWEGRTWSAIEADDCATSSPWMKHWIDRGPPGGESALDLERRVRSWCGQLRGGPILTVTHAGVIRALHVLVSRLSWTDAMALEIRHLEPIRFRLE